MSRVSDLAQLLALRSLREEKARAAVEIAAARLRDAARALSRADTEIEAHEQETAQQERRFFEAMRMRPLPENEFGRSRDLMHLSDQKRDALIDTRNEAAARMKDCEAQLEEARAAWRSRLFERDKLAEADGLLRQADRARSDALDEQEMDEMSADRMRLSC